MFKLWHISLWKTNVISHILLCFVLHSITDLSTDKPARTLFGYGRVISKVTRLGGENGQSLHNRASNVELGTKIFQNDISRTQTSFSTKSGGKLSFILSFLFPEGLHGCYMYFHCSYLHNYYSYSPTLCCKMLSFSI